MKRIVLLRHGQSVWNKENRFTGWSDVDLTTLGMEEAARAGKLLKASGILFEKAFTSYLKRANKTLNVVLDEMNQDWIPVEKTWKLNGRHYGVLEGIEKTSMNFLHGNEMVQQWRRSYNVSPPKMDKDDPRAPNFDDRYKSIPSSLLPLGESLKEASERIIPYWDEVVLSSLKTFDSLLVVSHANTIRAIVKYMKKMSDKEIELIDIPTATPYVFTFDEKLEFVEDYYL